MDLWRVALRTLAPTTTTGGMMTTDFSFSIRTTRFDEDYVPSSGSRITTNFANADDYLRAGEFLALNDHEEAGLLDLLLEARIVVNTEKSLITPSNRTAFICKRGPSYTGED